MELHKLFRNFVPILLGLYLAWYSLSDYLFWVNQLIALAALSVVAWTLAYFLNDLTNDDVVEAHNKAVLITGCDTGFGHELAQRLDQFGFNVFAGVLFPNGEGAQKLKQNGSSRMEILKMDVTKQGDVENVVSAIKESNLPLWAVVNNAGIGVFCPFEWGNDVDEYKKVFDVNVFGVVRVSKFCIPLLRKSKGRIVNVASLAGRITAAGIGHYCMSKHCVRTFSDSLRRELYTDEIKVITLEPTFYRTEIINNQQLSETRNRIFERTPEEIKESYKKANVDEGMNSAASLVHDIARVNVGEVIDAMEAAVKLKSPKPYYRCCGYPDLIVWAVSHLPETLVDAMFAAVIHNQYASTGLGLFARLMSKI